MFKNFSDAFVNESIKYIAKTVDNIAPFVKTKEAIINNTAIAYLHHNKTLATNIADLIGPLKIQVQSNGTSVLESINMKHNVQVALVASEQYAIDDIIKSDKLRLVDATKFMKVIDVVNKCKDIARKCYVDLASNSSTNVFKKYRLREPMIVCDGDTMHFIMQWPQEAFGSEQSRTQDANERDAFDKIHAVEQECVKLAKSVSLQCITNR